MKARTAAVRGTGFEGGLRALTERAQREARRRNRRSNSGYALLVMLHDDPTAGRLLQRSGVTESALLSALKLVDDESHAAFEIAIERAMKGAHDRGQAPAPIHFLWACVRDARTTAYRCLGVMGVPIAAVRSQAEKALGEGLRSGAMLSANVGHASQALGAGGGRVTPVPSRPSTSLSLPGQPRPARAPTPPKARRARPVAKKNVRVPEKAEATPSTAQVCTEVSRVTKAPTSRYALDPKAYPLLSQVGRNLTELAEKGAFDPVVGREVEVERVLDVLARRRANNPVLIGLPGVGKTAIAEAVAQRIVAGERVGSLAGAVMVEVSAGALLSGTGVRGALSERMKQLRSEVADHGSVILFIDEIHALVGGEGPDDLATELKTALARGELPCLGATTDAEYRRYFERDAALARRFTPVQVNEPKADDALRILRRLSTKYELHHGVAYSEEALKAAVDLSVRFITQRQLPDKAIALLDQAGARVQRRRAKSGAAVVAHRDVAEVVAEEASVPLERLTVSDAAKLISLEDRLADRVVGHPEVLRRAADVLRKGAAGLYGGRPIGTFLFLGPTGVGKTEMAKALADEMFAGAMSRFDMSEFSERHAVARLLGAPPGYVGHEDGGQLTEAVRLRPYQVILLDEVEKAHPEVLLSLLPLLDEGRLTDSRGRTVDFTNTIVIMTSNLGAHAPRTAPRIGFGQAELGAKDDGPLRAARAALPPELWNRIDEPLAFGALREQDVRDIAERMLHALGERLRKERGIVLEVEPCVLDTLVAAGGFEPSLGARPMRRVIARLVESPLASFILEGDVRSGQTVRLSGARDRVALTVAD